MSKTTAISTEGIKLDFGKHTGELLTRVPIGYIRWMCNQEGLNPRWKQLAQAEFERRGDTMPLVELSGHAIDNASLRVRKAWHQTCRDEEGLYSWLQRMTLEAIEHGQRAGDKIHYNGLKMVIRQGPEYPVLMTVMPSKRDVKAIGIFVSESFRLTSPSIKPKPNQRILVVCNGEKKAKLGDYWINYGEEKANIVWTDDAIVIDWSDVLGWMSEPKLRPEIVEELKEVLT